LRCIGQPLTIMLQATKNLTKFVELIKPSEDSIINLSVKSSGELDLFFYLRKGNGISTFLRLLEYGTLTLKKRDYGYYLDFNGTIEGINVEVTFLNEAGSSDEDVARYEASVSDADEAEVERAYPEEVAGFRKEILNKLTFEEWTNYVSEFQIERPWYPIREFVAKQDDSSLSYIIGGAFAWDRTKQGREYWKTISNR